MLLLLGYCACVRRAACFANDVIGALVHGRSGCFVTLDIRNVYLCEETNILWIFTQSCPLSLKVKWLHSIPFKKYSSNFSVFWRDAVVWPSKWNLLKSTLSWCYLFHNIFQNGFQFFFSYTDGYTDIVTELITSRRQTWKTVSPSSSGILRNDSSRSRDTDDSIFASQSDSVSCSRLNSSICLRMSAEVWIELDSRRQTFPHRVVMEATCFLIRSESYWSVDFESSSARREIFSSCGFRTSISPAVACWNKREDTRSSPL